MRLCIDDVDQHHEEGTDTGPYLDRGMMYCDTCGILPGMTPTKGTGPYEERSQEQPFHHSPPRPQYQYSRGSPSTIVKNSHARVVPASPVTPAQMLLTWIP